MTTVAPYAITLTNSSGNDTVLHSLLSSASTKRLERRGKSPPYLELYPRVDQVRSAGKERGHFQLPCSQEASL